MSPTSPLYLWREIESKGAGEERKNTLLIAVVLNGHLQYLKHSTHLDAFTQTFVLPWFEWFDADEFVHPLNYPGNWRQKLPISCICPMASGVRYDVSSLIAFTVQKLAMMLRWAIIKDGRLDTNPLVWIRQYKQPHESHVCGDDVSWCDEV